MKKLLFIFPLALILVLVACNMPSNIQPTQSSPDAAFTQAAQTVSAELTRIAQSATATPNAPTEQPLPTNTFTVAPTNTPVPTPTKTPIPCLMVGFNNSTIDVTIPDNTVMSPGQSFIKTWKLINMGACTWNSSYQLVLDHGDGMGVPNNYAQTLTSGSVAPGQSVDVSVSLVAPNATGTYTGYWRFRDPNGVLFGIGGAGAWIVKINVINAASLTSLPEAALSGSIRSDGTIVPDFIIGESSADNTKMVELFLSYDISSIPTNATITEVKTDLQDYTIAGKPFTLGVMNGYLSTHGTTLEAADYVNNFPAGNIIDWGSVTPLNTIEASTGLKTALQSMLGKGTHFQLRLQFPGSNNNAVTDSLTFAHPTLLIKYVTP
jgi:hypothetical protein